MKNRPGAISALTVLLLLAAPVCGRAGDTGLPGPLPEQVMQLSPGFVAMAEDGRSIAYVEQDSLRRWHFVARGRRTAPFASVASGIFSPDGRHFAFCARIERRWCVVLDDKAGPLYDSVGPPVFSADGSHLFHAVLDQGRMYLSDNGEPGPEFDGIYSNCLALTPGGAAYGVIDGDSSYVVLDGKRISRGYDGLSCLIASPDGEHLAYVGLRGNKAIPVIDGVEGPGFDNFLNEIAFDPAGSTAAFAMMESVDGGLENFIEVYRKEAGALQPAARIGPLQDAAPWSLLFAPDGSTLLYGLRRGPAGEILRWSGPLGAGALYRLLSDSTATIESRRIPGPSGDAFRDAAANPEKDRGAAEASRASSGDLTGFLTPFRFDEDGQEVSWIQIRAGQVLSHRIPWSRPPEGD